MTAQQIASLIRRELPYSPNTQQDALIDALSRFCEDIVNASAVESAGAEEVVRQVKDIDRAFVINGYAGTGKTSMVSALVRALIALKVNVVLMAPTGRAAKVFSAYSGFSASTIHRRIFRHSINGEIPALKENRDKNTLYIVDEASMISGDATYGNDILTDMLTYVFAGSNNRLILMGDTAQLPPVGEVKSPAMDVDILKSHGLRVSSATLTRVVRQGARSGILANAVNIRRNMIQNPGDIPKPQTDYFSDVRIITSEDLIEIIDSAYRSEGIDDTIIITRSNRRAADFNRAIRNEVLYFEEELERGEPLLIVKNNYYWTRVAKRRDIDFFANGDIVRIKRILGIEQKYGFRFADVEIVPVEESGDSENETAPIVVKIFLETLASDYAALPGERIRSLYENLVHYEYRDCADINAALANDPYWNALQTKYAYCVTCHKAQGGQWSNVIVDIAYINPDAVGPDLYRWMYTATTRARKKLAYLVG